MFPQPVPGNGINGGSSDLMSRLQAFLPAIAQANKDLEEKIQRDGADAVRIDLTIEEIKEADEVSPNVECEQSFADERSDDKKDPEANSDTEKEPKDRVIELNFAMGDFDDTPVAKLEEQSDESTIKQEQD